MSDREAKRPTLLVRAAIVQAKRHDARQRRDSAADRAHDAELEKPWRRFAELGGLAA